MRRKRRNHLPGFNARIALASIKDDKTLAELAEQFDQHQHKHQHQNQIQEWKKQLLEQADAVFGRGQDCKTADDSHWKDRYARIGE